MQCLKEFSYLKSITHFFFAGQLSLYSWNQFNYQQNIKIMTEADTTVFSPNETAKYRFEGNKDSTLNSLVETYLGLSS